MSFIAIWVCEEGVLRADVLVFDKNDYPEAVEFHQAIAPEISQLDQAIKDKFRG